MIFVALGSNLGERADQLARARQYLMDSGISILAESTVVETPALLLPNAPAEWNISFLNQVLQVETELAPEPLLATLKTIEQALGRVNRGRWSPREIDLDLLSYHDVVMESASLTLPHPQLHRRDFVLKPLVEIAPHWQHPVLKLTANHMLARL